MSHPPLSVRAQTRAVRSPPRRPRANLRRAAASPSEARAASRPATTDLACDAARINVPARRRPPRSSPRWRLRSRLRNRRFESVGPATTGSRRRRRRLSFAELSRRVQDEVGDLIFDVIMLACVCERASGDHVGPGRFVVVHERGGAASARRPSVGDGAGDARSSTGAIWGRVRTITTEEAASGAARRRMEKAARAPGGGPMPPAPPRDV